MTELERLKESYLPYQKDWLKILNRIRRSKDPFVDRKLQSKQIEALESLLELNK